MFQTSLAAEEEFSHPNNWTAKLSFKIQQGKYTIKVADNISEFNQVLELRKQVFLSEFAIDDLSTLSIIISGK